jgi:phosphoribosylformylglycinamidine cyclo-ligase
MKRVIDKCRPQIHGMIHCSGGGQTKVLRFISNLHVIKDSLFELPPLFRMIQESSETDWDEMYEVYNMGHRFELYTREAVAGEIISMAGEMDIEARIIGRVESYSGHRVTIKSPQGTFIY